MDVDVDRLSLLTFLLLALLLVPSGGRAALLLAALRAYLGPLISGAGGGGSTSQDESDRPVKTAAAESAKPADSLPSETTAGPYTQQKAHS